MAANSRAMPNLYELRLDDNEEDYDYCEETRQQILNNISLTPRGTVALRLGNDHHCPPDEEDLEKGDAGSPMYYGQTFTSCNKKDPSGHASSSFHHHHHHDSTNENGGSHDSTSPRLSSSSTTIVSIRNNAPAATPHSPSKPVVISTSTLHVTPAPPTPIGAFRSWSVEAFEFAKQFVFEKIGRTQKTADVELEKRVESVKETQRQFKVVYDLAKNLAVHYRQVVYTQRILSEVFVDLSHKNPEAGLCEQFNCNALTQRLLAKNGDALLACLDTFLKSMLTLCNTTIEDTLATVKDLENNRLKYDAYRSYLEKVRTAPRDNQYTLRLQEAERNFTKYQTKYSRLHHDLNIKLKFLDENKVKVCQKHLFLFHRGFLDYISGNRRGIEDVLSQFGGFQSTPASSSMTFLEAPINLTSRGTVASPGGHEVSRNSNNNVQINSCSLKAAANLPTSIDACKQQFKLDEISSSGTAVLTHHGVKP